MAANGPITGIQQHFNLYRVREIKTQRNVSAASFENERETKIEDSDEEEGGGRKWIPPKIEVEPHRPRVPLPITVKTVVYNPDDSSVPNAHLNRKGLTGTMIQTDSLSNFGMDLDIIFNLLLSSISCKSIIENLERPDLIGV